MRYRWRRQRPRAPIVVLLNLASGGRCLGSGRNLEGVRHRRDDRDRLGGECLFLLRLLDRVEAILFRQPIDDARLVAAFRFAIGDRGGAVLHHCRCAGEAAMFRRCAAAARGQQDQGADGEQCSNVKRCHGVVFKFVLNGEQLYSRIFPKPIFFYTQL